MNVFVGLLSGIVGGAIVAVVSAQLSRRQQLTDAKRLAYFHFVGAIRTYVLAHTVAQNATDDASRAELGKRNDDAIYEVHLALAEVELVCTAKVRDLVDVMQDRIATDPREVGQVEWDGLIDAMRADIGAGK